MPTKPMYVLIFPKEYGPSSLACIPTYTTLNLTYKHLGSLSILISFILTLLFLCLLFTILKAISGCGFFQMSTFRSFAFNLLLNICWCVLTLNCSSFDKLHVSQLSQSTVGCNYLQLG